MKSHNIERKITIALDDFGKDRDFLQHTIMSDMACVHSDEVGVNFEVGAPITSSTWYDVVMAIDMLRSVFADQYDIVNVGFTEDYDWGWLSFSIMRPRESESESENEN